MIRPATVASNKKKGLTTEAPHSGNNNHKILNDPERGFGSLNIKYHLHIRSFHDDENNNNDKNNSYNNNNQENNHQNNNNTNNETIRYEKNNKHTKRIKGTNERLQEVVNNVSSLAVVQSTMRLLGFRKNNNNNNNSHHRQPKTETEKEWNLSTTSLLGSNKHVLLQILSLIVYLAACVANSEYLEGITTGQLCPDHVPYNKPLFITWFSYNYFIISILFVVVYCWYNKNNKADGKGSTLSFFYYYVSQVWAGRIGFKNAICLCTGIAYLLQMYNVTYIMGLECGVSVSLGNAIYQLETPFIVGLSVCFLKDKFVLPEALGILFSLIGVAFIVLPPLYHNSSSLDNHHDIFESSCPLLLFHHNNPESSSSSSFKTSAMAIGLFATVVSAVIGSIYLVFWRVLDEWKDGDENENDSNNNNNNQESRLKGFIDTHMTLAMIGICNLILGWPLLVIMHYTGFETFELPSSSFFSVFSSSSLLLVSPSSSSSQYWSILNMNGLIEYLFDVSTAVAIYMTSPIVTSIVAPLTIPLALVAEKVLYGGGSFVIPFLGGDTAAVATATTNHTTTTMAPSDLTTNIVASDEEEAFYEWIVGILFILVGVFMLEMKPDLSQYYFKLTTTIIPTKKEEEGEEESTNSYRALLIP